MLGYMVVVFCCQCELPLQLLDFSTAEYMGDLLYHEKVFQYAYS
jgi:hypothetical protein